MRRAGALLIAGLMAGCATQPPPKAVACPAGQAELRTAQLFLTAKGPAKLGDKELVKFVADEVTPRFPDGVTVVNGGAQWKGPENQLIHDAAKVVLIVLPNGRNPQGDVNAVQKAYHRRFQQDSVVVMPPPKCVAP